jgi:hypothetical protein
LLINTWLAKEAAATNIVLPIVGRTEVIIFCSPFYLLFGLM